MIKREYKKFNRWKDEVKRLVFEKENKSPTMEKNNGNEENGPTMERNKKMEENDIDIREGVKKNNRFFLGLCPKHRTPPTHRARLGLH